MKTLLACLVAALMATSTFSLSAAQAAPTQATLRAQLDVDASGKVTAVAWPHLKPAAQPLVARLERVIRQWEYEPGSVDGVAVDTRTGLTLTVSASRNASGGLVMSITDARTGAIPDQMVVPRYPQEMARAGVSATVVMLLEVGEDGHVARVSADGYHGRSKSSKVRAQFVEASTQAAMLWRFTPEVVAGKAQPSRVRLPFTYCMDDRGCSYEDKAGERVAAPPPPADSALALDSVVKIKSQTTVTDI